jgi:hypothetical protein
LKKVPCSNVSNLLASGAAPTPEKRSRFNKDFIANDCLIVLPPAHKLDQTTSSRIRRMSAPDLPCLHPLVA